MKRSGELVTEAISTEDVPEREQGEFWASQINSAFFAMDVEYEGSHPRAFRAGFTRQASQNYKLGLVSTQAGRVKRTNRHARRDSHDGYMLAAVESGSLFVSSWDETARFPRGSAGLLELESPFDSDSAESSRIWLMSIPRPEIDRRLNASALLTAGFDFTRGLGRVVGDMVWNLHEERDALTARQFDAVCDRLVELLCMLAAGDDRPDVTGSLGDVAAAVRRYIREHAHDPALTGECVADALGWSLRQVQLAMQRSGTTLRDVIKDERLRLVHGRLLSPACRHLTVSQIAATSGFSSLSSLSTAFRERYGASPRDYRADHLPE